MYLHKYIQLISGYILLTHLFSCSTNRYDYLFEPGDGRWTELEARHLTDQLKARAQKFAKRFRVSPQYDCTHIGPVAEADNHEGGDDGVSVSQLSAHLALKEKLILHHRVAMQLNEVVRAN